MVKWVLDEDRRLERRLRELLERQQLSRFDTLMFLLYPAAIAGLSALTNASWQIHALSEFEFFPGLTAADIVVWLTLFVVFLILGFILFVWAYASDSIRRRIEAAGLLGFLSFLTAEFVLLVIGIATLVGPVRERLWVGVPQPLRGFETWLGGATFVTIMAWMLAMVVAALEVLLHIQRLIAVWFMRHLQLLRGKDTESLALGPLPRRPFTVLTVLWLAICLPSYAFGIAYVFWLQGSLSGLLAYHYWVFVVLVVTSVFLMIRRFARVNRHFGEADPKDQ